MKIVVSSAHCPLLLCWLWCWAFVFPRAQENVAYFNRLLNIIHLHAPQAKIFLVMGPNDLVAALERELGVTAKGEPVPPPKQQQQQPATAHAPPPGADQPVEEVPLPASGLRVLGFGRVAHINLRARNAMRAAGYRGEGLVLPLDKSDAENLAALSEALQKEEYDAVAIGGGVTMLSPLVERTQVNEPAEGSCSAHHSACGLLRQPTRPVADFPVSAVHLSCLFSLLLRLRRRARLRSTAC